jgi:predicted transcriptional regulator
MDILKNALVASIAVFAPIQAVIIITGALVFADLITGILAARKRGDKINSAGLGRTVTKTTVYLTAVCMGFLVEKYMINEIISISKIVSGIIGMVELKSLMENLNTIHGQNIFKEIIYKLGSHNDKKGK